MHIHGGSRGSIRRLGILTGAMSAKTHHDMRLQFFFEAPPRLRLSTVPFLSPRGGGIGPGSIPEAGDFARFRARRMLVCTATRQPEPGVTIYTARARLESCSA